MRRVLLALALAALLTAPAASAAAQGCHAHTLSGTRVSGISYSHLPCHAQLSADAPLHVWLFQGYAGDCVQIDMVSAEVDAYLVLGRGNDISAIRAGTHVLAENDDANGSLNARIRARLPARDKYHVVATTAPGTTPAAGRYALTVQRVTCP